MEVVAVVGLIASIGSLVDLCAKVIAHLSEVASTSSDLPRSFSCLADRLPLLTRSLQHIRARAQANRVPEDEAKELEKLVKSISDQVQFLRQCLDRITTPANASRLERLLSALKGLAKDEKVKLAVTKVHHGIDVLLLHQSTVNVDISDRILDQLTHLKVEEAIRDASVTFATHLSNEHYTTRQMIEQSFEKIHNDIFDTLKGYAEAIKSNASDVGRQICASNTHTRQDDSQYSSEILEMSETVTSKIPVRKTKRFVSYSNMFGWFGKAIISVHKIYSGDDLTHVLTEWLLVPSPWLFRFRSAVKVQYLRSIIARESPKLVLRPMQIVSDDSAIVCAIRSHDVETARLLLQQKVVYPSAVTADGENLLHLVAREILHTTFIRYKATCEKDEGLKLACLVEPTKQDENVLLTLQRFFLDLLTQDIDPAQKSQQGSSALEILFTIFQFGLERHCGDVIYRAMSLSITEAEGNPFHLDSGYTVGDLLRRYSRSISYQRRCTFVGEVLRDPQWELCANDGISLANAQALSVLFHFGSESGESFEQWNPTRDKIDQELDQFFSGRLRIVEHLVSTMYNNILEPIDREAYDVVETIVFGLKEALEMSLIYASRLKGLTGDQEQITLVRTSIVTEVTIMLKVASLFLERFEDDLLEWCDEWEVMDIWIESLKRHGTPVPAKTRKAWKEKKKYYRFDDIQDVDVS